MSAETLRRAASLMRERANSAAAQSGEVWTRRVQVGGYSWLEPAHIGMRGYHSTTEHIASWHPVVALAVADWLDRVADDDHDGDGPNGCHECDPAADVARAYLGGSS